MEIGKEKAVKVEYTLSSESGEVLDTSRGREPLCYIQGTGSMIPGFEAALEGKKTKDKFSFKVTPADGYGERNESLIFTVPKERFQDSENLQVGMRFQVQGQQGTMVMAVSRIAENEVVLDANHPLAGSTLNFDVEVMDVRNATKEELESANSRQSCGCSCEEDSCKGGCEEDSCKGGCGE